MRPMAGAGRATLSSRSSASRDGAADDLGQHPMAFVARVDPVGELLGPDDVAARHESQSLVAGVDARLRDLLHRRPQVDQRGAEPVGCRLRVGTHDRAGHHDRRLGVALAHDVEERVACRRASCSTLNGMRVQQFVPWVIEMTSAVERSDLLGRDDLAAGRAGVAHVARRRGRCVRPAIAGQASAGPDATQPSAIESP